MKYEKINKDKVFDLLINTHTDFMNPIGGVINISNIASLLKTSRYQVKKYIDELKADGMVELVCIAIPCDDELFPPYWGYQFTKKAEGMDIYKNEYQKSVDLLDECFGCDNETLDECFSCTK